MISYRHLNYCHLYYYRFGNVSKGCIHRSTDSDQRRQHCRNAMWLRLGTRNSVHGQVVQRQTGIFPLRAQRAAAYESVPIGHHKRRRKYKNEFKEGMRENLGISSLPSSFAARYVDLIILYLKGLIYFRFLVIII